ncbi:MAG: endopeptidase La [Polyangiaceae bacterium]
MTQLRGGARAPRSPFPLLPLRTGVLFPSSVITLPVGRERSIALLSSLDAGAIIGVVAQKQSSTVEPTFEDMHGTGTYARVDRVVRVSERELRVVLTGLGRFRLDGLEASEPYFLARATPLEEEGEDDGESERLARALVAEFKSATKDGGRSFGDLDGDDLEPAIVADRVAAVLGLTTEREVELLAETRVPERLRRVAEIFGDVKATADVKKKIDGDVRREFGKNQREAVLREQLKAIQKELGDDRTESDFARIKERVEKADLSDEARETAQRELRRLEAIQPQSAEYNVIRTYLEWICDLPWNARAEGTFDLDAVSAKLDADHDGLPDVKKRILEHLAVLKLSGNARGNILCLYGPPGVGKTSLGQSIADATGRPFVRISLGGVRDEAEVRGHRRTYVGALPGRILHALKKAKAKNAIVLLDEIDKLGQGWAGSPEAALLEVLDPEQNRTFVDHYLELPFDLSEVIFLCTANSLEPLSAPLRDRLEIIELSGYTEEEKVRIARTHLVPKLLEEHAIGKDSLRLGDDALRAIVRDYTREAGVRQLKRQVMKLVRSLALAIAKKPDAKPETVTVGEADLKTHLGKPKFFAEVRERTSVPGVATGLAWTPVGGDILFVETSRMPGSGKLEITGQLGDVMKESARAALTYVRSNAGVLGIEPGFLATSDLHVHVPAGAVPKDGPSAGVTIFTALASLLSGRRVRPDTAMTGEVTLRGRVLPVGGIKSKVLAAHRAGITRVILPAKNERDLEDVPEDARAAMEFFFADDMSDVLSRALEDGTKSVLDDVPAVAAATDDSAGVDPVHRPGA